MEAEGAPMVEDGLSYRARKEAFVSGLEGTSMLEVALVVSVVPVGLWLADLAVRALQLRGSTSMARLLVEFCCLVTPLLLSMTLETRALSSKFVDQLGLVVATVASGVLLRWRKHEPEMEAPVAEHAAGHVTAFRSGLLLMTCTAILAVDFPVFPRRFAKTETYGTGLMDVGVGGFVVSNAIVLGLDGSYETLKLTMWRAISSTGVLVTIGLARLALTKSVDYQEHASEYGLHWNFFFTLAAVSLGSSVLYGACLPRCLVRRPGLVGLMLLGLHQVLLSQGGLEAWVLHSSRDNLLSQNKEGLTSVIGYLSLFSLGIELGRFHASPKEEDAQRTPGALIWYHLWCAAALYAGTLCSTVWLGPVSRRLANAGYVLWTLALSQQLLAQVLLLQVALPPPLCLGSSPGLIAEAINYNQIAVFLLANLLTGACNLGVRTLDTKNELAVNILFLYLFTVIAVAYGLYCLRQRVKPAHALRFLVSREARATAKTQ